MATQLNTLLDEIDRQKTEYIIPSNIKSGVTVLGVTGVVETRKPEQEKTVNPDILEVEVIPDEDYVLSKVTVSAVDSTIDSNIIPTNIRAGVTVLGVEGNLEPDKPNQSKTVDPDVVEQTVVADTGYELAQVTVNPVTSSIDSNIVENNIRDGITILGVTGTLAGGPMTQAEYDNALELSEMVLGDYITQDMADDVGPILNSVLGVSESNDEGGRITEVDALLDDIMGVQD